MAHIATVGLNFSKHDELRIEEGDEVPAELVEPWMVDQALVMDDAVDWSGLAALSDDAKRDLSAAIERDAAAAEVAKAPKVKPTATKPKGGDA